jgi:hypothetical protein
VSRRIRVNDRLRRAVVVVAAVGSLASPAAGEDRGDVQITAIAPADCRLFQASDASAAGGAAAVRLACNTPRPAEVTVNLAGLDGAALLIDGKAVVAGPDGLAALSTSQLGKRADWRLLGVKAPGGAPLEVTIVAN